MAVLLGILIGAIAAYSLPEAFLWLRPALRPAFFVTMFFVGTLVRAGEVRAFLATPMRTLLGLTAQYTVMPLLAFAISRYFDDPQVRTGIVLVGCMPGAMASNVMTVLFRGDLMLSVTMTTIATLLCPLVLAFWLPLLADLSVQVPIAGLVGDAFWMVALPVALGITLRWFRDEMPTGWDRLATGIASASIVLIILVVVAANHAKLQTLGPGLVASMLILNIGGYGLAFGVGTLLRWPPKQRRTLVIEVGMQNAGLGSVLALEHLGEAGAVPSAFYTALCVITAALALPVVRRWMGES